MSFYPDPDSHIRDKVCIVLELDLYQNYTTKKN